MTDIKEKRGTPRIEQKLAIKVKEGDFSAVVETKNISASGVYFSMDKLMPLMSKLVITLLLPTGANKNTKVECSGTVVRVLPVTSDSKTRYETAIFFDDVSDRTRSIISRHVKKAMSRA